MHYIRVDAARTMDLKNTVGKPALHPALSITFSGRQVMLGILDLVSGRESEHHEKVPKQESGSLKGH